MPDCTTVSITGASSTVEAVVADTSVDGSTVTVSAYVNNIAESGGGQDWSGELIITLNGDPQANSSVSAAAGSQSTTVDFTLEGVPDGDHEVCAETSGGEFL